MNLKEFRNTVDELMLNCERLLNKRTDFDCRPIDSDDISGDPEQDAAQLSEYEAAQCRHTIGRRVRRFNSAGPRWVEQSHTKEYPVTKQEIDIDDFSEWSGGFTPDECTDDEVRQYLDEYDDVYTLTAVVQFISALPAKAVASALESIDMSDSEWRQIVRTLKTKLSE